MMPGQTLCVQNWHVSLSASCWDADWSRENSWERSLPSCPSSDSLTLLDVVNCFDFLMLTMEHRSNDASVDWYLIQGPFWLFVIVAMVTLKMMVGKALESFVFNNALHQLESQEILFNSYVLTWLSCVPQLCASSSLPACWGVMLCSSSSLGCALNQLGVT